MYQQPVDALKVQAESSTIAGILQLTGLAMSVFLQGLALQNFRGIGPKLQRMGPFKQFTIFIGANNSGKSSVLNFISRFLPLRSPGEANNIMPLDKFSGGTAGPVVMQIGIPLTTFNAAAFQAMRHPGDYARALLEKLCHTLAEDDLVWLEGDTRHNTRLSIGKDSKEVESLLSARDWSLLWTGMSGATGGSIREHWIPDTLRLIADAQNLGLPTTRLIPAIRQIGPKSEDFADYSGRGLIDRLAEYQSPDHDRRSDRLVFDKINAFLKTVTDHSDAQIEIPHNREHVLVHIGGKVLPLESLGTGIQEVIMIAAFCTISDKEIICIEEPELHLHPLLQRKLMEYLRTETKNQYFIATHSPTFIDVPGAAIFHVSQQEKQTVFRESILRSQRFAICTDLGHKASDLLQSNAVIWVEGPSDRIYIRHWLKKLAPEFVEGIHFSIMFYGGRLLSHLSAVDDEITEFIELRSLNRHLAIVMDSDRSRSSDPLNATKLRLQKELGTDGGVAWVTAGREIENYIDHALLQQAIRAQYESSYAQPLKGGRFEHALHFRRSSPKKSRTSLIEKDVDKVKIAREVCKNPANLGIMDLETRIAELTTMIRAANL